MSFETSEPELSALGALKRTPNTQTQDISIENRAKALSNEYKGRDQNVLHYLCSIHLLLKSGNENQHQVDTLIQCLFKAISLFIYVPLAIIVIGFPFPLVGVKLLFYFYSFIFLERNFASTQSTFLHLLGFVILATGLMQALGPFRQIWPYDRYTNMKCAVAIFGIHIYWYFCRWLLLLNLFFRRFKASRLKEMLEETNQARIAKLYRCHCTLNLILFGFFLIPIPIIATIITVELEHNQMRLKNTILETSAVIILMITFLLLYIVYIIPKPQHFSRKFLCVYICSGLVNMLLFMGAMVIFVVYISIGSLTFTEAGCLIAILFASGFLMDVFLMLKSKTLLTKSLLYTSIALVLLGATYYFMIFLKIQDVKTNLSAFYAFGMLSVSQFILHFFHRKKGKKSDDSDLESDEKVKPFQEHRVQQKQEDQSITNIQGSPQRLLRSSSRLK